VPHAEGASSEPIIPASLMQTEVRMKWNDLSRSLAPFEQDACVIAVVELSRSTWLVAGNAPGIERQPLKKLDPDEKALLRLLHRWRDEATRKGRVIKRIAVAY
jgi:transposase